MPHEEQKRPLLVMSVPQVVQVDMNFPNSLSRRRAHRRLPLRVPSAVTPTAIRTKLED